MTKYPTEQLDENHDNGTMPSNVNDLREAVIGHRIVKVEKGRTVLDGFKRRSTGTIITLDNERQVRLANTSDCCAYTELDTFLLHADRIDHVITGVGTTDGYTRWHIYADMGDVLELSVGWSCGNPFYYGYGFNITVCDT